MSTPPVPTPPPGSSVGASGAQGVVASGWLGQQSIFDQKDERKLGRAAIGSLTFHVGLLFAVLWVMNSKPVDRTLPPPPQEIPKVVFLEQPGPGGGGGGSPAPAPKRELSIPKTKAPDPIPVTPPPVVTPPTPQVIPQLNAPIITTASDVLQASGVSSVSLANYGGGGRGGGIGSGTGTGVGPGTGGGFGGGAFQPGNGVTLPELVKKVDPTYSPEAVTRKIMGDVTLEVVVLANGTVGDIRVVGSLDAKYGLDQMAIEAAKKWLFRPGRKQGVPVDVIVTLVLTFRLH